MATIGMGVASAGATALGLGMGAKDLSLTGDLFKLQMRQSKRLWAADWAEGSWRHGESMLQSAKQHSEAQALAAATYFQAEKQHRAEFRQAADMDARSFEMSWRAEVREALRDELQNLNNRFNNIMLCDTVCLSCAFGMISDGDLPPETSKSVVTMYALTLGVSIMMFTTSLWSAVIIVRRLNESTASTLERKLFFSDDTLQALWKQQLEVDQPTGVEIMIALAKAFECWVDGNCEPIGSRATIMLSSGVVSLFVAAGLLTHTKYVIEFEGKANTAIILFWACVFVTVSTVVAMQMREDRREKRKEGPYDSAWQDAIHTKSSKGTSSTGIDSHDSREVEDLYAKVTRAGKRLQRTMQGPGYATTAGVVASAQREEEERAECAAPTALRENWELLRQQSAERRAVREEVVQMLTAAGIKEEREALPEELTSQLNKILYNVEAIDCQTQEAVERDSESMAETPDLPTEAVLAATTSAAALGVDPGTADAMRRSHSRHPTAPVPSPPAPMVGPVDLNNTPVHLPEVRRKLGDIARTTLLRLRNESTEVLRCVEGRVLESGTWIESMEVQHQTNASTYKLELLPPDQIPARTEVVIAARSTGSFVPTSGVEGRLLYAARQNESWNFEIDFKNLLISSKRSVRVQASDAGGTGAAAALRRTASSAVAWEMRKDELDRKENNEVIITITQIKGVDAWELRSLQEESNRVIKEGSLLKNSPAGLRLRWAKRWFRLTGEELLYYENKASRQPSGSIALSDIHRLIQTDDAFENFVFDIELKTSGRDSYRLSADDQHTQRDWMHAIQNTIELRASRQRQSADGTGDQRLPQRATIRSVGDPTGDQPAHVGQYVAPGLSAEQYVAPARGETSWPEPEPEREPEQVKASSGSVLSRGSSALSEKSGSLRDAFSLSQTSLRQQPTALRSSLLGVEMSDTGVGSGSAASTSGFVLDEPDDSV